MNFCGSSWLMIGRLAFGWFDGKRPGGALVTAVACFSFRRNAGFLVRYSKYVFWFVSPKMHRKCERVIANLFMYNFNHN